MGLLVLDRRAGETVVLGDRVTLSVDSIDGDRVTLNISRNDGTLGYERTLNGPDAEHAVGPVRIRARRPNAARQSVKLSFAAPRHLAIVRGELLAAA